MKQKIGVHINYWNGTGAERDPQELLSLAACIGAAWLAVATAAVLAVRGRRGGRRRHHARHGPRDA